MRASERVLQRRSRIGILRSGGSVEVLGGDLMAESVRRGSSSRCTSGFWSPFVVETLA